MAVRMNDSPMLPAGYVNALLGMNDDTKLRIIRLLTDSLLKDSVAPVECSEDYTRSMLDKHAGSWRGEESADEIMACVRENSSNRQPLDF